MKEHPLTPSIVFILGFTFHCFKEFGGASKDVVGDGGCLAIDAPPSSLIDLIVIPKGIAKGEGVGTRPLVCSTLGVEGRVGALRWD